MTTLSQRSFSGGEIGDELSFRVDTIKYVTGLKTMRNFYTMRHGGATNRPGTKFVCEVNDSSKVVRLIPFVFNSTQTYILEFGDEYMRVIRNGAQVSDLSLTITGVTKADPGVVTYTGTDPSNGDEVFISGVGGMTELNNRNFKIANVNAGSNTFELQLMDGSTDLNTTGYTTYTSGGTAERIYQITTPYDSSDLSELQFVQSADVITIVHPEYQPRDLSRTGHSSWSLDVITFKPESARATGLNASTGGGSGETYEWQVTAIDPDTLEESLPAIEATKNITAITKANPAVVTISSHGYSNGQQVEIASVGGMTELNGRRFTIAGVTTNTFQLQGEDSSNHTTYTSGGTAARTSTVLSGVGDVGTNAHTVSWTSNDALEYYIYRKVNGVYGFVGTSNIGSFVDGVGDSSVDTSISPPRYAEPFFGADNYPSSVSYIQQRKTYANTNNNPEKVFMSQTGNYKNFTTRSPLQDDDSVSFTMAGRQVNSIRHLLDLSSFVVMTETGEWVVQGDASGIIKPGDINPKQQSYNGSDANLSPIVIDNTALYVQARGAIVRDLGFDFSVDGYKGNDLTVFSPHLFESYTISDWAYQQIPHSIVWAVRSDGTFLGLTYVKEQQIFAWHRHDFGSDSAENVAVIPSGNEDQVYFVVNRTIGGTTKRYIEYFSSRVIDTDAIEDSIFMDSTLSYDGTNTAATTMTLSGGTNWTYDETLTLTASTSYFDSSKVGNEIHLTGSDGELIRFTINTYSSATVVTGKANRTVPSSLQSTATSTWGEAVDQVTGLWHLEGKSVSIFADGFVAASPNNASYTAVTVSNGTVTLDRAYVVIHVGLPYICDLQTLDVDTSQTETLANKNKIIKAVHMYVDNTRGLWAGRKPPSSDTTDPLEYLTELKIRDNEDMDSPVSLASKVVTIPILPEWNSNGRVFIRQVDPVPATILGIMPEGMMPFKGGQNG